MGASQWRPVLSINDRGLALGVATDGSWVVLQDASPVGPASEHLTALLPVLEQPYPQVQAAVAVHSSPHQPGPPWRALLELALRWPTEYWPGLALSRLEDGHPVAGLLDVLGELKDAPNSRNRSQPLRHRALRVWRAADR
jgi:hypothetical protein